MIRSDVKKFVGALHNYRKYLISKREKIKLHQLKTSKLYIYGSVLFPPGSNYESTIVVREALVSPTSVETQYYSSVLMRFPPICYYCRVGERNPL